MGGGVGLHGLGDAAVVFAPLAGHIHRHGIALPGIGDGGGEQLGQGLGAKAAVQGGPTGGGAGDHGGQPALLGHLVKAQFPDLIGGEGHGGHAAGV